ncbi:MAG TPA: Crp/Fnr family transcriptional regulator [Falsiroseomonas sp.]|jgi:CRP-like cAMP-binding protein|nr:Crp/Fnr family transcriptional regulator [Falsiroseomonas sp.]
MANPWVRKMEQFTSFSDEDRQRLDELASKRQRRYAAREDIIREGEHSPDNHLIISGLACRYKLLPDGGRQIVGFLVPGDLCDAEIFILKEMDHSIGTIGPCLIAAVPGETMRELLLTRPGIALALWWGTLQDEGVMRARLVDLGRRDARERVAHILYEVLIRYRMTGSTSDDSCDWPATQTDLADATGLTTVHVNRTLQSLREEGLITIDGKRLTVLDREGLRKAGNFNANYLHLDRAVGEPDSAAGKRVEGLL